MPSKDSMPDLHIWILDLFLLYGLFDDSSAVLLWLVLAVCLNFVCWGSCVKNFVSLIMNFSLIP